MKNKLLERPRTAWPALFENDWVDRLFNAPIDEYFNMSRIASVPAVNVSETEKDFQLCLAVPGMDRKDFKVETIEDMLTISAEKEKEEKHQGNGHYNRREYNYSSWSRSFTLPENCDSNKIDAQYKNGELMIIIPKKEIKEAKKTTHINVS
jgi:HSP20 family protein